MRIAIVLLAFAVTAGSAAAGRRAGVTMADTVTVGGTQLHLNGMGLREATWLKVDVYVAGLYVERVSSDPAKLLASDQTKLLVLRFKRDVGHDDIAKAWSEGFRNNPTVPYAQLKRSIDQLNAWMPSFKEGDTLAFLYIPGKGVAVDINNQRKGIIAGDDFARALYSIWLGPNPPGGDLKRGLLGNHARS